MNRILILGGGASGMAAAISAAEHTSKDTAVILLEQNSKLGKKLLATGNGRCNLDNTTCTVDRYFTSDPQTASMLLLHIEQINLQSWFTEHGLLCREAEDGRLYPYSNQAADVVNLLIYWLEQLHVQVHTDCRVTEIAQADDTFTVVTADGSKFNGNAIICAMGGNAGPQFGSEGFGIKTAFRSGCQMEPLYPCLVPLKCNKEQIQNLSGIRVKAAASLYDEAQLIHTEVGEIQFTDYGISGIAIMQLSGWLGTQYGLQHPTIRLNLFPQYTEDALTTLLVDRAQRMPNASIIDYMTGLVHPQIGLAVWHTCNLGNETRIVSSLQTKEWNLLAQGLQQWVFSDLQDTGWKNAQTTGGGIALHQIEPHSFQLKEKHGMYFVGETVDCAGYCGGYNLHLAFGSGILAGKHAAEKLKNE